MYTTWKCAYWSLTSYIKCCRNLVNAWQDVLNITLGIRYWSVDWREETTFGSSYQMETTFGSGCQMGLTKLR